MKNLLMKFIPGFALSIAVVMLAAARAQSNGSPAPSSPPPPAAAPAPQVQVQVVQPGQPMIVCGVCGAQIGQPQQVLVAPGVDAQEGAYCEQGRYPARLVRGYDGSYYFEAGGIPPAPVYSLTDYWRADPRLIVPERRFVRGNVPVRHFHH